MRCHALKGLSQIFCFLNDIPQVRSLHLVADGTLTKIVQIDSLQPKIGCNNNDNNDFISIALFHVKHAQLR